LTLFTLTEVAQDGGPAMGLVYLAVFGAGSVVGMIAMSLFIAIPFRLRMFERVLLPMRILAGAGSAVFGLSYAWKIVGRL
jgi:cytochrome c biogenesis protein CcdA